ncbi:uncharacterized protein C8A04DRAFT_27326 [Dichotomopilus funicola]|uniref:DUF221-domain-containing protein n=1 Tax=Dichotomopilus funicola TaxID=1934379 RepID=A0AAN6V5G8_9PEZI|nr:hypothetical protein C8A04DRAFT_27326 [Dichotomopilus funicola]
MGLFAGLFEDPDNPDDGACNPDKYVGPSQKDTQVQLVISVALGLSAFLSFCAFRPGWKSLYAARKRHSNPLLGLPTLPDTFFGWIPTLYKITEQQVLSSAGLDAYVFLAFFKMSIRLFGTMFFFAAVVLEPINRHFLGDVNTNGATLFYEYRTDRDPILPPTIPGSIQKPDRDPDNSFDRNKGYLWSYLVFAYLFTGLTLYFMDKETLKVIRVRQDYLGTQSTVTDRTFRLSGIPEELRTEEAIKDLVQKLEIGKVESVTLCRDWKELDHLMDQRQTILERLEETWSVYLAQKPLIPTGRRPDGNEANGPNHNPAGDLDAEAVDEEAGEGDQLLAGGRAGQTLERVRPQTRFWYGFLRLQSRKTDAIDYYTERLRRLDDKIMTARKKTYEPANLAFVTMDSIAACQMAIQAVIDPHPGRLLTKPAPAPSDVVWKNTYATRFSRRSRSWTVTTFVAILSVIWAVPVAFLASVLSICIIDEFFSSFGQWLREHEVARSLVQTGLPTLVVSLLNVAVPYLYDYLSWHQGMISQGDIALSAVSKNFFFTFFNIFLLFTVFGTVTSIFDVLRNSLTDATYIAYTLAQKIEDLSVFYTNFIMLQGLGLFPFRLLQFGSVAQYPILRMGAKTPRDFSQLVQPSMFHYGFYLPTALLVFILCLVYSVIPNGYQVLGLGVAYFTLGYFTYKYQLLYAMDQPQHATGGAWRIICYRIMLGLVVFHVTMSGYLALKKAFTVALLVAPLFIATVWYGWEFRNRVEPLTRFISLRSIERPGDGGESAILDDDLGQEGGEEREVLRRGSTVDEDREKGLRFVNPNLVLPLEQPWIYEDPPPPLVDTDTDEAPDQPPHNSDNNRNNNNSPHYNGSGYQTPPRGAGANSSTASSVSLGDTHIWRE